MKNAANSSLPGCFHPVNGRWYWTVTLPGEGKPRQIGLRPAGAKYATNDKRTALQVAAALWDAAVEKAAHPGKVGATMAELRAAYLAWAANEYPDRRTGGPSAHLKNLKAATAYAIATIPDPASPADGVIRLGEKLAEDFNSTDLLLIRNGMIAADLARSTINARVHHIKAMMKWAAGPLSGHMIPASVHHDMTTLGSLRKGSQKARETKKVRSADEADARRTMAFASPTVAGLIELQILTGMRSSEALRLTIAEIDMVTDPTAWAYKPADHKTADKDIDRNIFFGPRAQEIIKGRLGSKSVNAPLFTPRDSAREQGRREWDGPTAPAATYTASTYWSAVDAAIRRANKAEAAEAAAAGREPRPMPHWHPHQLRHTLATSFSQTFGEDAARATLGHTTLAMTARYIDPDLAKARDAARKIG